MKYFMDFKNFYFFFKIPCLIYYIYQVIFYQVIIIYTLTKQNKINYIELKFQTLMELNLKKIKTKV